MPDAYPLQVQNAYADLLQRHLTRQRPRFEGSFRKKTVKGKKYWVEQRRIGHTQRTKYIGPDNEDVQRLVEQVRAEQALDKKFRTGATRLVQMIASAGAPAPDSKTGSLLRALAISGAFAQKAILIGTHAFRIYESILGVSLGREAMATEDVDIARQRTLRIAQQVESEPPIVEILQSLNLKPDFSTAHPEGAWRWVLEEGGLLVEFLTPSQSRGGDGGLVKIDDLNVHALQLKFLDFLLEDPLDAVALYREGVLVKVPNPTRFALHKVIVSAIRGSREIAQARKDRVQAAALLALLLEEQPLEVEALWREALARGPNWRRALKAGAKSLPEPIARELADLSAQ